MALINEELKAKRLGEIAENKHGCLMKIIEYNNSNDITVEFQDDYRYKTHTTYGNFTKRTIVNPYSPTICGVGISGAKYPSSYRNSNGETVHTKEYLTFKSMITRCYNPNYHKQQPTYAQVECCKEWLNRDNFEDWLRSQKNYEKFLNGGFALDKDILVKGNKVYSPETCCLVPQRINGLFEKNKKKDSDLPIGVKKYYGKYVVYCCVNCKNIYVGTYKTRQEAFVAYKLFKENYIKQVAREEFDAGNITKECCDAMMKYEVEITD